MAVKFLNSLDVSGNGGLGITLNNTELTSFKVDNVTSDPTVTGEGQMIYRTDTNALKFYNGTSWVTLGDASAAGTVTSVAFTHGGNAFSKTVTDPTGDAAIAVTMAGAATQYINGLGNLVNLSTLPQGDITAILAGDGLTGSNLSGPIPTIDVDYAGTDNVILAAGAGTIEGADIIMYSDNDTSAVATATIASILALAPQGDITGLTEGTYIGIDDPNGPVPTINHDSTTRSDSTSAASPAFGATFTAVDSVTTNTTGHLTALNLKTVTLPTAPTNTNTTYTLPVSAGGANSSVITLDASTGTDTTVTFNGTTNEIALTESVGANGSITIGLPDDVTIGDDLTVEGIITQSQTNETNTFASEVAVPTATASGNAPNLGQVQSLIAGVGIFQGGYNATTGLTTDLASNGSLDGASNIELDKGDYFVVTVAGGAFYSETLEVGDMIYANQDITASSTPAITVYTVVIQDENIAGAGATDGATQKGVAGFDSATFTVSASGWVQSKLFTGTQAGVVPNTSGNSATVFLNGQGAFTTPANDNTTYTASTGLTLTGTVFSANVDGTQSVAANASSSTADKTYKVQVDSTDQLVVNVPWVDTNTQTVTSVDEITPGTSTGTPIVIDPTTGAVKVKSMAYNGNTNVGHVPTGGGATTFLRGDGTWVTPTNTQGVTTVTASTVGNLDGLSATPTSGAVVVGLDINGMTEAPGNADSEDKFPIYDDSQSANRYIDADKLAGLMRSLNTFTGNIANGQSTGKFVHGLGINVMVQCYESSTGDTVYADIQRNPDGDNVNEIQATVGTAVATGSILVMVTKIQQLSV